MNDVKNTIKQIKKISSRNIESESKIKGFLNDPAVPITFFNWECPPRFIKSGKDYKKYVSFNVDMSKIAKSIPIDIYTEIPRVLTSKSDEIKIINYLNSLGINFKFVKIIADTNSMFLYPESLKYDGKGIINKKLGEFRDLIFTQLQDYPCQIEIVFFWNLLKDNNLQDKYIKAFESTYKNLLNPNQTILPAEYFEKQLQRTREHIGITDKNKSIDLAARTIATYGAEGLVLNKLSMKESFSNCIWLNIEEVSDRTIRITNFLRERNNIPPLPMIFPKVDLLCKMTKTPR